MNKQIKTLSQMRDSRLLFEKQLPPFGYFFILLVTVFLAAIILWSIQAPKAYMITAHGTVTSSHSNYVMSGYSGEIGSCNMKEGQLVDEGEVLFTIKSTDYDVQQKQLEESRETYEIQVSQYERPVQSIKDDTNYFDASKAEDDLYYSAYEAYKSQVVQNELNTDSYRAYGYTDEQIVSELEKNQGKIAEIYYSAIQNAQNAIQEAKVQIASIDAQLSAIGSGQAEYSIKATASGRLHLLADYKPGMVVQASGTVATITPENSETILESYVSTADMARMKKGDTVKIAIDGLTESVYGNIKGTVEQIDTNLTVQENGDGTTANVFRIKIKPEVDYLVNKSGDKVDLVNGMTALARIEYDKVTYFQYVLEKLGFKAR